MVCFGFEWWRKIEQKTYFMRSRVGVVEQFSAMFLFKQRKPKLNLSLAFDELLCFPLYWMFFGDNFCTYPFNVSILIFFLVDNNSLCFSLRCDSIPVKCHIMWLFSSNGFVYLLCSFLNVPFQGLCWSIFQSYRYGINFWIDAPDLTIKMNVHSVDFHIVFLHVVSCFWRFSFVSYVFGT